MTKSASRRKEGKGTQLGLSKRELGLFSQRLWANTRDFQQQWTDDRLLKSRITKVTSSLCVSSLCEVSVVWIDDKCDRFQAAGGSMQTLANSYSKIFVGPACSAGIILICFPNRFYVILSPAYNLSLYSRFSGIKILIISSYYFLNYSLFVIYFLDFCSYVVGWCKRRIFQRSGCY